MTQTNKQLKTLALSELRHVAEQTRLVKVRNNEGRIEEVIERIPWNVWYVAGSNGDVICGEECVTIAVYPHDGPGAFGSRLVRFTSSGQTRRLRDCCILRANNFVLVV